jgi:hypothetical protein
MYLRCLVFAQGRVSDRVEMRWLAGMGGVSDIESCGETKGEGEIYVSRAVETDELREENAGWATPE